MPRLPPAERLERAVKIRDQAEATIRKASAQLRAKDRKDDNRRKILLGSLLAEVMAQDPKARSFFERRLSTWLTRPQDLALFEGWEPPLPKTKG